LLQTANKFLEIFTKWNKANKKYNNSEYKRKMEIKKNAWTIST
jgi:hypothetical protein